jgi:hypothetical protein
LRGKIGADVGEAFPGHIGIGNERPYPVILLQRYVQLVLVLDPGLGSGVSGRTGGLCTGGTGRHSDQQCKEGNQPVKTASSHGSPVGMSPGNPDIWP